MSWKSKISVIAALAAGQANACLRLHAWLNNNFATGDSMSIQLYDNDVMVCRSGSTQYAASSDSRWTFDCDYPYEVELTYNGEKGEVWNHHVDYHAEFITRDSDTNAYCILQGEHGCRGFGSTIESALWDGFGDCDDSLSTSLCTKSVCDW